jgi:ABC-type cobalamin/Fe3+-siderophores transport system ATPase subunit
MILDECKRRKEKAMADIIRFKIEGLAGRSKPFEQTLNRHVNIFYGLNGCGKTSLLKILHSAMENDVSLLARVPFTAASVTIHSLSRKKAYTRTIRKTTTRELSPVSTEEASALVLEEAMTIRYARRENQGMRWKTTPADRDKSTAWFHRYLPTSRLLLGQLDTRSLITHGHSSMSEEQIDFFFAESMKRLWADYSAQLLGRINTAQQDGLASILKAVLSPKAQTVKKKAISGLDSHQAYERMKRFVTRQGSPSLLSAEEKFKGRFDADSTLRRVVSDIDGIEGQIEHASAPRRQLETMITSLFSGGKNVSFTDQSIEVKTASGNDIGTASLSSGEKHLLMILVETLLAGGSAIILDEPEISMHVDWQKQLIRNMRTLSSETQLIVATHSPEVIRQRCWDFMITSVSARR